MISTSKSLYFYQYLEKIWLIIDFLQLYTMLWNISQSWGMPFIWIYWTRSLVWSSLDYFSTTEYGALMGRSNFLNLSEWGQMSNYMSYCTCFSLIPIFFCIVYSSSVKYLNVYGKRLDLYMPYIEAFILFIGQLLYLPIGLVVFRLYYCENNLLAVDPVWNCTDHGYITYTIIFTTFLFPLYFVLPAIVYKLSLSSLVYNLPQDHEKRLVAREILYLLDIDNHYLKKHTWLIASFILSGSMHRLHMMLLKASMLILFVFFRNNYILQALLFFLAYTIFCIFSVLNFPYRRQSSNYLLILFSGALFVDVLFGKSALFELMLI